MSKTIQEFPLTLAAIRAYEIDSWSIGDNLLKECGEPGPDGVNNGSGEKLAAATIYLRGVGYDYAENTLRILRDISAIYPPATRVAGLGWSIHRAVPTPAMLRRIIDGLPAGETLTVAKAEMMVGVIRDLNDRRLEAQRIEEKEAATSAELAAKKREQDAARAAKAATSEAAKRKHEREQAKAHDEAQAAAKRRRIASQKVPKADPRRDAEPETGAVPAILLSANLLRAAGEAAKHARFAKKVIEERGDELRQTSVDAFVEAALAAHEAWLEVANLVRKGRKQRHHLAVVGAA